MSVRLGISILDLLPQTTGVALQIPDGIIEKIGVLTVINHRCTTSPAFFLHEGTLQSLADALDVDTSSWFLRIPGLTHGLPFRLSIARTASTVATGEELVPGLWTLDIEVRDVELLLPGLRAAKKMGGTGVTPLTLQPTGTTDAQKQVRLVAQGVVRITGGPGATPTLVQIVDAPDPLDPAAPTGTVIRLTAKPASFLFGNSQFGMTLDSVVLDLSQTYTPAEIEARGHDEVWEGVAYKEATFYFPPDTPLVHSLSVSTRDVIIGNPGGLQGELALEFGEDFNDLYNTRLSIKKHESNGSESDVAETTVGTRQTALQYAVTTGPGDTPIRLRAVFAVGDDQFVPGHTDLAVRGVWWKLPDGTEGNSVTTPWFDAPTTGLLRYRLRVGDPGTATTQPAQPSAVPNSERELIEVSVSFPRQAGSPSGIGPIVDATVGATTYNNVLHLRGPRERLQGMVLTKRGGGNVAWRLGSGSAPTDVPAAASFTIPPIASGITSMDLLVWDTNGRRRIRIEVTALGPLSIGHQMGSSPTSHGVVTVVGTGVATPTSVTDTFLARAFHDSNDRPSAAVPATLAGNEVTVPQGADAEVEVPIPSGETDPIPAPLPTPTTTGRVIQVQYDWDKSVPIKIMKAYTGSDTSGGADHEPSAWPLALHFNDRPMLVGNSDVNRIQNWIATLGPTAGIRKYYVVGRTDDLFYNGTLTENTNYNNNLATDRANAAKTLLLQAGVASSDIIVRIETALFSPPPPAIGPDNPPARITAAGRLALPTSKLATPTGADHPVWRSGWNPDSTNSDIHFSAKNDPRRPPYRCAEIFASDSGAAPTPVVPTPTGKPGVPTRILVPGPDGAPVAGLITTNTAPPPTDYRVRLKAKWDSPTIVSAADAIPTEAEVLVAWKKSQIELPPSASGTPPAVPAPPPSPPGQDFWEILIKWAYDASTGQTEASGALSLPDGTINISSNALAGALAFGPAMTSLVNPSNAINDPLGQFVTAAAMLAVGAAIGEILNSGGGPQSSVDIDKFTISYRWNGAPRVAATVDYTVDLRINVSVAGAGSLTGHLKLKYKGVGLRFDGAPGGGLAGVALTYDDLSVEVVDPGTWSLGGPLGNLIRIAASRMGNGSQWMEFDLEFALNLGVVRLEGATIRLGLEPFKVEFRGLSASVEIPATLKGKGSVSIGDGGSFRALMALEVIPAKLSAYGALAVDHDFVSIEVGVQLPVGIPLGGTGFGIFGFMGRFVANGTRNMDGLNNPDPVQNQLDWYVREPQLKYKPKSGQFAFGVGAVIGTLPDGGFTFNAEGSLTIGFPDVSVIFGIDAHLITQRKSPAEAKGTKNTASMRILGMVLIEPDSIMVAVRASYEIPKVLKMEIPISAYFPLAGGDAWFIRIGTDNHDLRPGDPVTIVLLPDTLDVRVWAFLLIEERNLLGLGGKLVPADLNVYALDFNGFSIGFGAGFDLKWTAGPFSLEITAFLLVGFGTKPMLFAGTAGIKGELDLVIISLGVDGVIHFHISDAATYLDGHFCAHIDFFFFEISGCVDIHIGDDIPINIPEPESPLSGIDLCDHLAAIKGKAARIAADTVPVVWPDTVAVLRCAHYMEDGLGASSDFVRKLIPPAALTSWTGSTELKYAYRLSLVELWKFTGGDINNDADWSKVTGPFDSAWWLPTHRPAIIEGGDSIPPSTEEGRELGLFSMDPHAWSRWLGEGSQDVPGDPANTIEKVCEESKPADPACAFGKDRKHLTGSLGLFKAEPMPGSAFPSRFNVIAALPADVDQAALIALASDAGWTFLPGAVVPLHGGIVLHGLPVTQGWRFPSLRRQGRLMATEPVGFTPSKALIEGEFILEVCLDNRDVPNQTVGGCDHMPDKDTVVDTFTGPTTHAKYGGGALKCFDAGGERAVLVQQGSMVGEIPGAVDMVSVELDPGSEFTLLTAFAADGSIVGQARTPGPGRQWLRVQVPAGKGAIITRMSLKCHSPTVIFEVCWGSNPKTGIFDLLHMQPSALPKVLATHVDGSVYELTPEVIAMPTPPAATVVIHTCPKLRYVLPKGSTPSMGWTHVQVSAWTRGDFALVAICGVTMEAAAAQQADSDYRDSWKNLLLELVDKVADNQPTHAVYLDANQTYEIRASWQYQGFRPSTAGEEPGLTESGTWKDASKQDRFRFQTADFGLAALPAPVQSTSLDVDPAQGGPGYDERTFDPRGISRYVTQVQPGLESPPHFLDDHVGFWFMVDHLEPLVDKYDRILQVKVLHTRPDVGSLYTAPPHAPGRKHILDVTLSVTWAVDTLSWFPADYRLVEAAKASPCIGGAPALGSSSVSVSADLKPSSEYDLLLNAAPKVINANPEVAIARSHFRTSRYRNPTEMLRALGLAPTMGLMAPNDAIATGPLSPVALKKGDTELDAALTTLGLDPWPLPAGPRTTAIWLRPVSAGQPWRLIGILLEGDEPIYRDGFKTGAFGEPDPKPRLEVKTLKLFKTHEVTKMALGLPGTKKHKTKVTTRTLLGNLIERVRNTAGTRSIFTPSAPILVTGGRLYDLELQFKENGLDGAMGKCPLFDRPLIVAQEGE